MEKGIKAKGEGEKAAFGSSVLFSSKESVFLIVFARVHKVRLNT